MIDGESKDPARISHRAMVTAAVVLAAGSSSRMGEPKALLAYRGRTFIEGILNMIHDAAIDYALVAVLQSDAKILENIDLTRVSVVYNGDAKDAGPIGSIRSAVSFCVNHMVDYLMIWPVDQPHVMPNTVSMLVNTVLAKRPMIAVPKFRGRRGHPVFFSREVFPELLSAVADEGAHSVVLRFPLRVLEVPVEDPAVLEDIDTPEDYQELLGRQ